MATRKISFSSRKTKKYSRKQKGGSIRRPTRVAMPNTPLPKRNSRMRAQIKSRRSGTTNQEAQSFLRKAHQDISMLAKSDLSKYKIILDEIKNSPTVYGTGKRTPEQIENMLFLAKRQGIEPENFKKLYTKSGTTALSSKVNEILGKLKARNSKAGYMTVDDISPYSKSPKGQGQYMNVAGAILSNPNPNSRGYIYVSPTTKRPGGNTSVTGEYINLAETGFG